MATRDSNGNRDQHTGIGATGQTPNHDAGSSKIAMTRRNLLIRATQVGAVLSILPGAIVGLGKEQADAAVTPLYTCLPGSVRDLSFHCYVSCVGPCSDSFSGCNSDPYQTQSPYTIECINGYGTGTPARAVAVCDPNHPHSEGYGCCVYC